MMRSMQSAVTGLRAQQTAMDTIGNNISNVNTAGFKASNVNFTDLFYQTLQQGNESVNPAQVGYGSQVSTIDKNMSSTGATETDNPLDLYIDGEGFFAANTKADGTGTTYYSRLGNFHIDPTGHLVDSSGNYIMGAKGSGSSVTLGAPVDIMGSTFRSSTGQITQVTSDVYKELSNIQINQDGTVSASIGDQVGVLSNDTAPNQLYNTANTYTTPITFDATTGVLMDSSATPKPVLDAGGNDISLIGMTIEDANGSGQVISASNLSSISGVTLNTATGAISATYTNSSGTPMTGTIKNATENDVDIALANFVNPNGLNESGNSYYVAGVSSGNPSYVIAGSGNATVIRSGELEMSNVDLAKEMTNMIVTERGFQANSRVITVSDSMLEELVNLKRS